MKKALCLVLTAALAMSSLTFAFASDDNAFAPYPQTVEVTIGRENIVSLDLPDGHNIEQNKYIDYLNSALNLKITYDWLADSSAYTEKVNLAIASGEIPDVMYVNSQAQLKQLVDNEMVEDLTDYMAPYFSDMMNDRFQKYGAYGLESAMFDGRMMALPNLNGGYEFSFMWVRQDWVTALGAQMPKTLDEVIALAKLFMEKDPNGNGEGKTIGIAVNPQVAGIYNNLGNIDPIFGTFGAFPRQWIRDENGAITYGTISQETKQALGYVADLYSNGVLDKEFAIRTGDNFNSLLLSGRCGIFFGPWWMPDWPLNAAIANNPQADWVPVLAPLDANGSFNVYRQKPNNQWIVVRKGYEHPEVVFKMLSYTIAHQSDDDVLNFYPGTSVLWTIWPVIMIYRDEDTIPQDYALLSEALETGNPEKLSAEQKNVYTQCKLWLDNKDLAAWQMYTCRVVGPEVTTRKEVKAFDNVYPLMTDSMELKWANLEKMENEMILKTIMGEASIDTFDSFVESWLAQGGEEITAEVNEQFK